MARIITPHPTSPGLTVQDTDLRAWFSFSSVHQMRRYFKRYSQQEKDLITGAAREAINLKLNEL